MVTRIHIMVTRHWVRIIGTTATTPLAIIRPSRPARAGGSRFYRRISRHDRRTSGSDAQTRAGVERWHRSPGVRTGRTTQQHASVVCLQIIHCSHRSSKTARYGLLQALGSFCRIRLHVFFRSTSGFPRRLLAQALPDDKRCVDQPPIHVHMFSTRVRGRIAHP